MKNLLLSVVVFASLLISCTNDTHFDETGILNNNIINHKETSKLNQTLGPENPANAFDYTGKIHNDILDVYLSGNYSASTAAEIVQKVDSIAALNSEFLSLEANIPINFIEIQSIIDAPYTQLQQEIAACPMTNNAKNCLSSFMDSLQLWETDEYAVIHQSVVSWEDSVINNPQFSSEEKRIILTSSSIARHSMYYAKERKDKDWETSVGNRAGAVQGAASNCSTAINRSVVAGLLIYNLQNQ